MKMPHVGLSTIWYLFDLFRSLLSRAVFCVLFESVFVLLFCRMDLFDFAFLAREMAKKATSACCFGIFADFMVSTCLLALRMIMKINLLLAEWRWQQFVKRSYRRQQVYWVSTQIWLGREARLLEKRKSDTSCRVCTSVSNKMCAREHDVWDPFTFIIEK